MKYLQGTPWPDAIDVRGVAEILGKTVNNVQCHYEELGIPFNRVAGRIIFIESEVRAWQTQKLAEQRRKLEQAEAEWNARQYALGARSAA